EAFTFDSSELDDIFLEDSLLETPSKFKLPRKQGATSMTSQAGDSHSSEILVALPVASNILPAKDSAAQPVVSADSPSPTEFSAAQLRLVF
ncbi:unnamed protein product, partial [Amoebophrya sp. A25]